MFKHLLSVCALLFVAATPSAAQQNGPLTELIATANLPALHRCADAPVDVSAASANDRDLACSGALRAVQLLGRCGISLRRPLRVDITGELRHPFGRVVLGYFEVEFETVHVRPSDDLSYLVSGTPFGALPPREVFMTVVAHEVVHGVLHQNSPEYVMGHTAGEYLAYALQIESFPSSVRDKFLQSIPNSGITNDFVFSDTMLSLNPYFFAAHAYRHFKASADPCGHVAALLEGEVSFIRDVP